MNSCKLCGWTYGSHDPSCPQPGTPEMQQWQKGYNDGSTGNAPHSAGCHYVMGYLRGESAREQATQTV